MPKRGNVPEGAYTVFLGDLAHRLEPSTYFDDGCKVAPRCLTCPLDRCVFDGPAAGRPYGHKAAWDRFYARFDRIDK